MAGTQDAATPSMHDPACCASQLIDVLGSTRLCGMISKKTGVRNRIIIINGRRPHGGRFSPTAALIGTLRSIPHRALRVDPRTPIDLDDGKCTICRVVHWPCVLGAATILRPRRHRRPRHRRASGASDRGTRDKMFLSFSSLFNRPRKGRQPPSSGL